MALVLARFGGEIAALSAAAFWAIAALFYSRARERIPARELNLIKGLLAIVLLSATWFITGEARLTGNASAASVVPVAPAIALLAASGSIGIGLGDTAYFEALKTLGVCRTLLLGILAPPLTALLAWIALGETLPLGAWAGIALTVIGVAWVITEQETATGSAISKAALWSGIGFGIAAALAQSIGALLSRVALTQTSVGALMSAVLRLAAGSLTMLVWFALERQPGQGLRNIPRDRKLWGTVILAVFMGTYLGVWLQQIAIQNAPVGTVQTLLATSQLFILPLAALRGEHVSPRAIIGAVIALGGVALLFQF